MNLLYSCNHQVQPYVRNRIDLFSAGTVARPTETWKTVHFVGSAIYPPVVGFADLQGAGLL
jgi:hypothetical protein